MNPTKRITDPTFAYVPSTHTNIAATFARVRAEMAAQAERERAGIVAPTNVAPIKIVQTGSIDNMLGLHVAAIDAAFVKARA